MDKNGKPTGSIANVMAALRHASEWQGVLKFNEFAVKVEIHAQPPLANYRWDKAEPWADEFDTLTWEWLHRNGIPASSESVGKAIWRVAREHSYSPVRDYLDGLTWDGTRRLDDWLITYAQADTAAKDDENRDDEIYAQQKKAYVQAVGSRWMISAVARIYQPGCQVDHVLVLEGEQGIGKSSLLNNLFSPWFTDCLPRLDNKDAYQATFGVWCIEIAEMAVWNKVDAETAKAYITRRSDHFRPPYGKNNIDQPRQCVFAGTINPTLGGYLKDQTGNRRYWVVLCHGVDLEGAARDRDQLFAEAVARYKAGSVWHLDDVKLVETAKQEQAERTQDDAWEDTVAAYVENIPHTTATEILCHGLNFETGRMNQMDKNRVGRIMTALGWKQKSVKVGGKPSKRWVNPNPPENVKFH